VCAIYIYVVNTHIFIYMVYMCDDHHLDMNISVMNGMDVVYHIVKCALFAHVSLGEDDLISANTSHMMLSKVSVMLSI